MARPNFRWWDRGLSEEDLTAALAAAGTLWDHRGYTPPFPANADILARRLRSVLQNQDLVRWLEPSFLTGGTLPLTPAPLLAAVWREVRREFGPLRFRVRALHGSAIWYARQLNGESPDTSASVRSNTPSTYMDWNWPVRIAFPGDDLSSEMEEKLRAWIAGDGRRLEPLVKFVELNSSDPVADLLLFANGGAVRQTLERSFTTVRANCLWLAGLDPEHWDDLLPDIDSAIGMTQAQGAVVAESDPRDPGPWFTNLIRELSHNLPMDRALRRIGLNAVVTGSDILLRGTSFPDVVKRISRNAEGSLVQVQVDSEMSRHLQMPEGTHDLHGIAQNLTRNLESFRYEGESDEATTIAKLSAAAEHTEPETPEGEPEVRMLQHRLRREHYGVRSLKIDHLESGRTYDLHLRVGPPDQEWNESDRRLADRVLPPTEEGGHLLTVVFSEPYSVPQPMVSSVFLPVRGPSSPCRFGFVVAPERGSFAGRVMVLHGNRVLQTAILSAPIGENRPKSGDAPGGIQFTIETVVRPASYLRGRRPFATSILLNRGEDGEPRATRVAGHRAALIPLRNLDDAIQAIKDTWDQFDWEDRLYRRMDAAETLALLHSLATHGRLLYEALVDDWQMEERLRLAPRIQMIATQVNSHLPVEYCYSRAAPAKDAKLCPKAQQALRAGSCDGMCDPSASEDSVICPLAFWGLSRIIEWHRFDPRDEESGDEEATARKVCALEAEPTPRRAKLEPLKKVMMAASAKVPPKEVNNLVARLNKLQAHKPSRVKSWKEWKNKIAREGPATLVLMPHTEMLRNVPTMEIGNELLDPPRIDPEHVSKPGEPPPIVLLLGCGKAVAAVPFQSMAAQFRRRGAAIVVSSIEELLEIHAPRLAGRILDELAAPSGPARTFGDVMLAAKRRCLREDLPIGLALVAYGDADWWV